MTFASSHLETVAAHHSFAMFEMEKSTEYSGVVTEWKWQNPHVHFNVLVKASQGVDPQTVGTWDVEGGSVMITTRQGWTRASYKVGDAIKLVGHPMKDGSKGISLFYSDPTGRHAAVSRHRAAERRREKK